jgi:hypothetical protein
LCLQHQVNEVLDARMKGEIDFGQSSEAEPQHINFV